MLRILQFVIIFFLIGCNDTDEIFGQGTSSNKEISYSYSCLDSTFSGRPVSKKIDKASDLIRNLAISRKSITDSLQTAYGKEFHAAMVGDGSFKLVSNAAVQLKLSKALKELLAVREHPSSIEYAVYVLDDTTINAFTFGGRIYITRAMLDKCKGKDDLLYAIIGHEIGHSEKGHIKATIQELELSNKIFGEENGSFMFEMKKFLTASFNQKNELEADYYGINLTNELGYDVCTTVSFWKEMASHENKFNQMEDFFRTHPFSDLRAQCLTEHIRNNFNKNCGVFDKSNTMPQVLNNKTIK
jgi:predicted Zn-dependent protease